MYNLYSEYSKQHDYEIYVDEQQELVCKKKAGMQVKHLKI